jgi:hypothetical protein
MEKHGAGMPQRTIFKARKPAGEWHPGKGTEADLILSRILWLEGCEERNANTKERYIYIHGAPDTEPMGVPGSIGCIRMTNGDVAELFELVLVGTVVDIA